ncbi:MAG: 23S rRNA (uracil(1939)-C(5))-methyltransferase RlmD [Pseudomonadota bacterium]|nr:23S rRNA (uracil(1939)-C(5))-methyltransferase RlmD [Pseudomonadota bacterium]
MPLLAIESVDHEARGVAHIDGKVAFIDGALTGETVRARIYKHRPSYDQGETVEVVRAGASRVVPVCPHFGVCGGCNMQHADPAAQVAFKQRILEDNLQRIGRVRAEVMLPAIQGPAWGYRHRARLSVRLVQKKGGVLVGFHERNSSFVAQMSSCRILPAAVSLLIEPLRELVSGLSLSDRLPQIEVAVGELATVLVFRVLQALTPQDEQALRAFADRHGVQVWLQTKGPDTARRFHPLEAPELDYRLPEFGLRFPFGPSEFTQVNPHVNRVLVRRAMRLLAPRPGERVADLFCGLGNFSLPIAACGADVVGVEGSAILVRRAAENAALNGLAARCRFEVADLFQATPQTLAALGPLDAMLIDPPRDGAVEVVKAIGAAGPQRIVYVSCNPSTLARDAQILVHQHGYRLRSAGVANMFPHTAHVESIALFTR